MNNTRSFANKPKLDRQEKPNSAKVKKKTPIEQGEFQLGTLLGIYLPSLFWKPGISFLESHMGFYFQNKKRKTYVTLRNSSPHITSR